MPCGACTGCCRSSMFIHVRPSETKTIQRIPRAVLFDAPGLPKGHLLMGYDEQGRCPMLIDDRCSIYEDRPQTCRDFDCRIYAATALSDDHETQAVIAQRVREWVFHYESEEERQEHATLQAAAAFLEKNRGLFPPGTLPNQPGPLAIVAIRIYRLFAGIAQKTSAEIVHAIATALSRDPRRQRSWW